MKSYVKINLKNNKTEFYNEYANKTIIRFYKTNAAAYAARTKFLNNLKWIESFKKLNDGLYPTKAAAELYKKEDERIITVETINKYGTNLAPAYALEKNDKTRGYKIAAIYDDKTNNPIARIRYNPKTKQCYDTISRRIIFNGKKINLSECPEYIETKYNPLDYPSIYITWELGADI